MFGAVIVDSRPIASEVIDRHLRYLPGWELNVFTQVPGKLRDQFEGNYYGSPPIKTGNDYNNFLLSESFWNKLTKYERVLIFQHDSELLREGIEEFLEYDFIGAPLYHIPFPAMNGGLSLRNPQKMIEMLKKGLPKPGHNEDIRFCYALQQNRGKLPTKEVAQKFSVETIFGLGSLGVHQIESYLNPEQCEQIRKQYDIVFN